jgi:hypothetical protein
LKEAMGRELMASFIIQKEGGYDGKEDIAE